MNIYESIEQHEGHREKPYLDTKGIPTFGIGLTYITLEESRAVVKMRVDYIISRIGNKIKNLSPVQQDVLIEMAYQLGITGLFKFKKMWVAISRHDYQEAAREMLDSQWARSDSPGRAKELADRFLNN